MRGQRNKITTREIGTGQKLTVFQQVKGKWSPNTTDMRFMLVKNTADLPTFVKKVSLQPEAKYIQCI